MGGRIRELREKRGISQEILANELGVVQQTISKLEKDKYKVPTDLLIHIAGYFEVTVDYILGLSDLKRSFEGQQRINRRMDEYYEYVRLLEGLNQTNQKTVKVLLERLQEAQKER